jgi:glycosyltransferase involved in cell wall biosynthesis
MALYPLVSIIIPTFNAEANIPHCLDSITAQTYEKIEILVIDGGSSDNTIDIVKAYESNFTRIKHISEPDKGIYDAMNKGIELATGEWLLFLGADDWLFDKLVIEKIFGFSETNSADVIYGNVFTLQGINIGQRGFHGLMRSNICHQAIFYRKVILKKYQGYDIKYRIRADNLLNIQLFCDETVKWKYYDLIISHFSLNGISNLELDFKFLDDIEKIYLENFRKHLKKTEIYVGLQPAAFVCLKYYKFWKGINLLWKSGYLFYLIPDILYCIKVRFGFKNEK